MICFFIFFYSAIPFLSWGSKFQDMFVFSFSFIYILVIFSCFLFFCFGQYIFLYWGSNFQDMFLIFNFMFFCIFLYWAIRPLFWGFQISGYIFVL